MAYSPSIRKMDESFLRTVGLNKTPHVLQSKWHMWYHNPGKREFTKDSFVDLFPKPIESLEELIVLFNSWDEALPAADQGMYYLMRNTPRGPIYPCREDPHNQHGGYWTSKISTDKAMEVWKKLCFLMVNETIVEDWKKINGVSITPKNGFCLVKIWNGKDDMCEISQLKTYLSNFLDMNACMYFSNQVKIAIDSRKQRHIHKRQDRYKKTGYDTSKRPHPKKMPIVKKPMTSSRPITRDISFGTSSFGGGWRDLLKQQTESSIKGYRPPV